MPTTIQTIKEAEEKLIDKFSNIEIKGNILRGKCSECKNPDVLVKDSDMKAIELGVFKDFKSHITQTLLAVFESELANVPAEFSPLFPCEACETEDGENQCPNCFVMQGRNNIFAKQRSHYTEVINYLKQN